MPPFKIEFATVKELEKKTFKVFGYGGVVLAVGLLFALLGLVIIGAPIMVVGGVVIMAGIAWVSMLGKEPTNHVFCPYCSSGNDVYQSRRSFECDICGRAVQISETGEPMMAESLDHESRYRR